MVDAGTKLTLEEFLALPEADINYEFVNGQAVPKVSPKEFHSMLTFALTTLLTQWSKQRGRVRLEWAIALKRQGEDWSPVPDVTYISYERLPASRKRNEACPVPPELVIEIISPDQTIKDFADKAKDYFNAGVSQVWIVDPEAISIRVFYSDGSNKIYTDTTPILDALLPGLELTARQVFKEAELI